MSYPSNPFGPPGHQPQPYPQANPQANPQAWSPVEQAGYAGPGPGWGPQQPFAPAPKSGNGLAIAAIVLGSLALLGVLALALFMSLGPLLGPSSYVLSGKVTTIDKGASDGDLQESLTVAIKGDGGQVAQIHCPLRSQVGQGLVTVCHGSVDGLDWTGVVVFEDDAGSFIVTEY